MNKWGFIKGERGEATKSYSGKVMVGVGSRKVGYLSHNPTYEKHGLILQCFHI